MINRSGRKVRLLVVDDHPVVRTGIRNCLAAHPDFEVVGEASNGAEALAMACELAPEVVLMDLHMPEMDGMEATRLLRKEVPKAKVLVLSVDQKKDTILQVVRSGAQGYVLKDAPPEELVRAIESVARGETFFSSEVAKIVLNHCMTENGETPSPVHLTERERQVLAMIADGLTNKEVATRLNVSTRTVEAHREHIMRKLNVHSVVGLTRYAIAHGIIRPE